MQTALQTELTLPCPPPTSDDYTTWASRKRAFLDSSSTSKPSKTIIELHATNLILSKQPKSVGAWEHKGFIFQLALLQCKSEEETQRLIASEVQICTRALHRHARTYGSYNHLIALVDAMDVEQLIEEKLRCKSWISKNISDASAFHHLDFVIQRIHQRSAILALGFQHRVRATVEEIAWSSKLCNDYPGHESIWQYRRQANARLIDCFLNHPDRLISKPLASVDLSPLICEHQRFFQQYSWWMAPSLQSEPNLDVLYQVVFDEIAFARRLGLLQTDLANDLIGLEKSTQAKTFLLHRGLALKFCAWLCEYFAKRAWEVYLFSELAVNGRRPMAVEVYERFIALAEVKKNSKLAA